MRRFLTKISKRDLYREAEDQSNLAVMRYQKVGWGNGNGFRRHLNISALPIYLTSLHRPSKTGLLFSLNALSASSLSLVATTPSYASFSLSPPLSHPFTAFSASLIAIGPPSQIPLANSVALSKTLSLAIPNSLALHLPLGSAAVGPSMSLSHSPRKYASAAFTLLPVRIISLARCRPMTDGRRYVPPAPGRIASRVSGSATSTLLVKSRRVVVSASSRPPPKAGA